MKKLGVLSLTLVGLMLGLSFKLPLVSASALDTYRDLLVRKTFTLKYENITPHSNSTRKQKINLYGQSTMDTSTVNMLQNKPTVNTVVCDGNKKYEEISSGMFSSCRLKTGNDNYSFARITNLGKTEYFGHKKGEVMSTPVNLEALVAYGESYGDPEMTTFLSALLPDAQKTEGMPKARFVNEGYLDNGSNYEDYEITVNDSKEIARYYFKNYALVKIAGARYYTDATGKLNGTKIILQVDEFSPTPDKKYLSLPEGLKDTTKRDKKGVL